MARGNKRAAEPPGKFENKPTEDIRVWILSCEDYFDRNSYQWEKEEDRIKFALGKMTGEEVAPFAITYRKKMTGEFGYPKHEGYGFWITFCSEVRERFSVLHRAQKALADMEKVKYAGNVEKYLLTLENLNIEAEVTGIAWRSLVQRQLPVEAMRTLSHEKHDLDSDWLQAVRRVTKAEESFTAQLKLNKNDDSHKNKDYSKRKREFETTKPNPKSNWNKKRKTYTDAEKAAYKAKKEAEKNNPGKVTTKVEHTNWKQAHPEISQKVVDERKKAKQCTRCGMDNHSWRQCRKQPQVSTIGQRRQFAHPKNKFQSKKPQVSTMIQEEVASLPKVNQINRPKVWELDEMDET
jgi:hypothetical protein